MEFNDLVEICGQALIIYFCAKLVLWMLGVNRFVTDMNETNENVKKYLASIIHSVKTEKHGDTIYFFDEESDAFIAQGRNDTELTEALKARWRDHIFIIGQKHYMAGPDFIMQEIRDPDEVGKLLANRVLNKQ